MSRRLPDKAELLAAAAQTWQALFNEDFPNHLRVRWRWHLKDAQGRGTAGGIHRRGPIRSYIELDYPFLCVVAHPLAVLVHEFAHTRGFEYHTKAFHQRVDDWLEKLNLPRIDSESPPRYD